MAEVGRMDRQNDSVTHLLPWLILNYANTVNA